MARRFGPILAAIFCLMVAAATPALAQGERPLCDAFYKNPDGSWTATQSVFLPGTTRVSRVGGVFRPGVEIDGVDVAATLDKACPNPATTAAQTQQPRSTLSQFADANGTIDIAGLTCGSLADATESEAALLLAWYGGAANRAPAKKRSFNLARLRTTIEDVVTFCKSHGEQSLLKVMDERMPR